MPSSSIHWEEFKKLPGPLHICPLLVLVLPEILSCQLRNETPRGGKPFTVLGSPGYLPWDR